MTNQQKGSTYSANRPSGFNGPIGVARKDISPPEGIYSRNWGAAASDILNSIHRPLLFSCVTFQASGKDSPLVLLSADLAIWGNAKDGQQLREKILQVFSIPPENLMFCLSHTHAAPSVSRDDQSKPGGEFIEAYLRQLEAAAMEVIREALASATICILTWKYGVCQLAANRDFVDSTHHRYVVGFNPVMAADDTLLVGRITDSNHKVKGILVNYACHPTSLGWENILISPDYVGAMRDLVENTIQAPCLFLQGASGDLAPVQQYSGNPGIADQNGRQLGYAVMATLESMLNPGMEFLPETVVESGAPLMVWKQEAYIHSRELKSALQEIKFELKPIPSLAEIEEQYRRCEDRVLKERLWRQRNVRKSLGEGESVSMSLWVWKLGDSFLVGQPNEAYSVFQLELRSELFPQAVAVMNLVNGSAGYLPPREYYDQDIYTVSQTPFAAGSLEQLTAIAIQTVQKMISNP